MHTLHWQHVTWSNEWWKLPCGCSSLILTVIPRSWCFSAPAPGSPNDYHHESLRHTAPASFCSRHDILRYETLRKKECIWGQLNHVERHKINNYALPLKSVSVYIEKLSWNSCIYYEYLPKNDSVTHESWAIYKQNTLSTICKMRSGKNLNILKQIQEITISTVW